mmetsp:Transcript_34849/g.55970  ORF Transcript_34849/g.55970 Transcript_34849/m.55970 type:complete len:206 (+) Transcript_34849:208-825(+)
MTHSFSVLMHPPFDSNLTKRNQRRFQLLIAFHIFISVQIRSYHSRQSLRIHLIHRTVIHRLHADIQQKQQSGQIRLRHFIDFQRKQIRRADISKKRRRQTTQQAIMQALHPQFDELSKDERIMPFLSHAVIAKRKLLHFVALDELFKAQHIHLRRHAVHKRGVFRTVLIHRRRHVILADIRDISICKQTDLLIALKFEQVLFERD